MNVNTNQGYPAGEKSLDDQIERVLQREFLLPEKVEAAQNMAFEKIRKMQEQMQTSKNETDDKASVWTGKDSESRGQKQISGRKTKDREAAMAAKESGNRGEAAEYEKVLRRESGKKNLRSRRRTFSKACAGFVAAAAAFSGVCIVNPAFGAQIPLVGHVFEELGNSLGFSGDFEKYAETLTEGSSQDGTVSETGSSAGIPLYSQTVNGTTITLSEAYCNDTALYISLVMTSEEAFPETALDQDQKPIVTLDGITLQLDGEVVTLYNYNLEGKFTDDYTYAGVLRFDLTEIEDALGGIPENFTAKLNIPQVVGDKKNPDSKPEMPQDLVDAYNAAMAENGLSTDEADYHNFTEEQMDIENRLANEQYNEYAKRYPDAVASPNKYENWWVDGPWDFSVDVSINSSDSVVVEIGDVDENGLGLVSVTKTPMEIVVKDGNGADYFTVALDADGNRMSYGGDGSCNTFAIGDSDVSKIDVYICDWDEYMNELKGYWSSEDYAEKAKTKNLQTAPRRAGALPQGDYFRLSFQKIIFAGRSVTRKYEKAAGIGTL